MDRLTPKSEDGLLGDEAIVREIKEVCRQFRCSYSAELEYPPYKREQFRRVAKAQRDLTRVDILGVFKKRIELASHDDAYLRILVEDTIADFETGKTRKQRADEGYYLKKLGVTIG